MPQPKKFGQQISSSSHLSGQVLHGASGGGLGPSGRNVSKHLRSIPGFLSNEKKD